MKKLFAIILSLGLIIAPMPAAHAAGGGYLKTVLGMANGIIGSTILLKCKMTFSQPSLILYLSGSLVYVAAEILAGKGKAKSVENNSQSLDATRAGMVEGGDYQKAAVQGQIDNEKANLAHIQKKRKFMMATKVIYSLAAIAAMVEFVLAYTPPIFKTEIGGCSSDPVSHIPMETAVVMAYKAAQGYAAGGLMGAGIAMALPKIMEFLGQQKLANTVVDKAVNLLNLGIGRVGVFLAAAALVFVIDGSLKKEEDRSKKIIADLEKVKAQFDGADNSLADSSDAGETSGAEAGAGSGAGVKDPSKKQYAIKALPKGVELAKHCYSQAGGSMNYSEESCKSTFKLTRPKFDASMNIPTLTAGTNASVDMAQAMADGDLARADIEAGNLAAMAGRVDAVKDDLLKKINDKLKKDGKSAVNPNEILKKQIADLNAAMNAAKPGSGNYSLADLENNEAATGDTASTDNSAAEIKTVSAPETVAVGADAGIDLSKIDSGLGEGVIDPNANANVATLDQSLNDYESTESDISKDRDVSIFKQVSNRYFLNYTKIFQRKEINPPLAEPAPAP